MKKLIITHANCLDGCCSRAILFDKYGDSADYMEVSHDQYSPDDEQKFNAFVKAVSAYKNSEVIMADICLPNIFIDLFVENGNKVTIIDHHKTAVNFVELIRQEKQTNPAYPVDVHFDAESKKSAALLTWETINPGVAVPTAVEYISDNDTWQFKYGDKTRHFTSGLFAIGIGSSPGELTNENLLHIMGIDNAAKAIINVGAVVYGGYLDKCHKVASNAIEVNYGGRKALMVECDDGELRSKVGEILYNKSGDFAVIWRQDDGFIRVSLRSINDADVSSIAERYGGGGHKNAAAFSLKNKDELDAIFPTKVSPKISPRA